MRFTKTGRVRFIGHLDMVRVWERAARRAQLPLVFTEGFSPRPRMHFGLALPTCYASTAEYLDVDLDDGTDVEASVAGLNAVLPDGIEVLAAARLAADTASLQSVVTASDYIVVAEAEADTVADGISAVLAAEDLELEIRRKGRMQTIDLRPGVLELEEARAEDAVVLGPSADLATGRCLLRMRLAAQPRSYRPTEVCSVMQPPVVVKIAHRCAQLVGEPGSYSEPLVVGQPTHESMLHPDPIEERSGHGTLREEVPSEPPTAAPTPGSRA